MAFFWMWACDIFVWSSVKLKRSSIHSCRSDGDKPFRFIHPLNCAYFGRVDDAAIVLSFFNSRLKCCDDGRTEDGSKNNITDTMIHSFN